MSVKTLLMIINALRDQDTRRAIIISAAIPIAALFIFITLIVYILTSPFTDLSSYFSNEQAQIVQTFQDENKGIVSIQNQLTFMGKYPLPFDGDYTINSPYGYRVHPVWGNTRFHSGIDFGISWHSPVNTIADGQVILTGVNGGYGNCVIIRHQDTTGTFYSLYGHLSSIKCIKGQKVIQGQVIALEGGAASDPNPGTSTGHHLHFSVLDSGMNYVDPSIYIFDHKKT